MLGASSEAFIGESLKKERTRIHMLRVAIVTGSTRPGRNNEAVANINQLEFSVLESAIRRSQQGQAAACGKKCVKAFNVTKNPHVLNIQ